jgi:outer membrane protein OmpA-like peptidoglycan-associated protein
MLNNIYMFPSFKKGISILFLIFLTISSFGQENKVKSKTSEDKYDKPSHWASVQVKNANLINSERIDFSPSYYQSGVVFVSSRKNWGELDRSIDETFFDLYYSDLDEAGVPLSPTTFSRNLNSDLHEGPGCFNVAGDVFFFTRNNYQDGRKQADEDGYVGTKIYRASKGDYDWDNIQELPFNSDSYSCQHPSLSTDGKRLYFSSNMPGGKGGYDLYFVEWTKNGWSVPINMGPQVNTEANEAFPFIHGTGYLFFASDNDRSMGGLDIFLTDLNSTSALKPIALGTPFNSKEDDFGFIMDQDGVNGFLSSNRTRGKGKDDIYSFSMEGGLPFIAEKISIPVQLKVFDAENKEALGEAEIRVFELKEDGRYKNASVYEVTVEQHTDAGRGLDLLKKDLHQVGDVLIRTYSDGTAEIPLLNDRDYMISVYAKGYEPVEMPFSEYQSSRNTRELVIPLIKTDCLLQVTEVINSSTREPLADIPVELYDETERTRKVFYSNGQGQLELCLKPRYKYTLTSLASAFEPKSLSIPVIGQDAQSLSGLELKLELDVRSDIISEPLKEGVTIVLDDIYYDFDKSAIRAGDAKELDALASILNQYPSMEIDLIAHTDARGDKAYNQALSEQRAASAKQYLVKKGIAANRIQGIGKGESELRNKCADGVDCSDEEHQFNRRTEVVIRKMKETSKLRFVQER